MASCHSLNTSATVQQCNEPVTFWVTSVGAIITVTSKQWYKTRSSSVSVALLCIFITGFCATKTILWVRVLCVCVFHGFSTGSQGDLRGSPHWLRGGRHGQTQHQLLQRLFSVGESTDTVCKDTHTVRQIKIKNHVALTDWQRLCSRVSNVMVWTCMHRPPLSRRDTTKRYFYRQKLACACTFSIFSPPCWHTWRSKPIHATIPTPLINSQKPF